MLFFSYASNGWYYPKSQNHRITAGLRLETTLEIIQSKSSISEQCQLQHITQDHWVLNTSRGGEFTASLRNPLQYLNTLIVRKF